MLKTIVTAVMVLLPYNVQAQLVPYPEPPPPPPPVYSRCTCPACGHQTLVWGSAPCPDPSYGETCLVLHYGYTCQTCGKVFSGTCPTDSTWGSLREGVGQIPDTFMNTRLTPGKSIVIKTTDDTLRFTADPPPGRLEVLRMIDSALQTLGHWEAAAFLYYTDEPDPDCPCYTTEIVDTVWRWVRPEEKP